MTSHVTSGGFSIFLGTLGISLQYPSFHHVTIRRTEVLEDEELVSPSNVDKVMVWIQNPVRVGEYLKMIRNSPRQPLRAAVPAICTQEKD